MLKFMLGSQAPKQNGKCASARVLTSDGFSEAGVGNLVRAAFMAVELAV